MQGQNYIEAQEILDATNGGLDIILYIYPQAAGSELNRNQKFKVREEKSPSASLKKADDGNWLVTDFGGDQKPRNAIQCYMLENNMGYSETLQVLAAKYNVAGKDGNAPMIKAEFSKAPAGPDEQEGTWSYKIRKNFTDIDIETIISKKVIAYLEAEEARARMNFTGMLAKPKENNEIVSRYDAVYSKISAAFKKYRWHSLESYSIIKNREKLTYSATDQYPLFLIDEGSHQKLYQPKSPDKKYRFMYLGSKPKDFIHGFAQHNEAFKKKKEAAEAEKNDDKEDADRVGEQPDASQATKKTDPKLPQIVICSGGSDAINIALLGYPVIWLNSETASLSQYDYDQLMIITHKLYQLPDIDATGKKAAHALAMKFLDLLTIELPEELKQKRDARGNPCKDVRDYLNHYSSKDFKKLVDFALPYRFWERSAKYEGRGDNRIFVGYDYDFDNVQAYNFLVKNGFGRLSAGDKKTDWVYIRRQGNIVSEQHPNDIKNYIHSFLRDRLHDKNLRNAMYRTTQLSEGSLSNLDVLDIDFTDHTRDTQFFFFQNSTVEITPAGLIYHRPGDVERFIWEEDLLPRRIEKDTKPPFTITKDELGVYDIEIHDKDCPFLKYLIQTSRVHWRKELEERIVPAESDEYLKNYHFAIDGPNLQPEEIEEQKQHLINKLFAIGYLLHRYKARNKGWFVWGMDNKINDDGKSHGGSGKSILFDIALRAMMPKNFYINGRNPKLTDDPHKYDGLTEHHRYMLVDDAHEYMKLDSFYTDITGDVNVNPKGKKPFSIPFEKAGKFAFTTNYTPRDLGPSTERRMIYCVFSDYYHNKGETDDYKEMRDPKIDMGITLFTDFDQKQWNSFYHVMLYSLRFFLSVDEKIKPAMENVNKRNLLAQMGNYHDWALTYFSEESGRLDDFIVREQAFKDYVTFNGSKVTAQAFLNRTKAFCRYYGYVLNPKAYQSKNGPIIRKVEAKIFMSASNTWETIPNAKKEAKECFYIQTKNELREDHADDGHDGVPPPPDNNKELKW